MIPLMVAGQERSVILGWEKREEAKLVLEHGDGSVEVQPLKILWAVDYRGVHYTAIGEVHPTPDSPRVARLQVAYDPGPWTVRYKWGWDTDLDTATRSAGAVRVGLFDKGLSPVYLYDENPPPLFSNTYMFHKWTLDCARNLAQVWFYPHTLWSLDDGAQGWFRVEFLEDSKKMIDSQLVHSAQRGSEWARQPARRDFHRYQGEMVLIKANFARGTNLVMDVQPYFPQDSARVVQETTLIISTRYAPSYEAVKIKPGSLQEVFYKALLRESSQQTTQ